MPNIELSASYIPTKANDLTDDLFRNNLSSFLCKVPALRSKQVKVPTQLLEILLDTSGGLDVTKLDASLQGYFHNGLTASTHRSYNCALRRFNSFCMQYNVSDPFPVTEKLLCYFSTKLANDELAPQMIKVYLSAVRSMQLSLGLPPPREESTLPVLKRVLDGRASGNRTPCIHMPITVAVLRQIHAVLGAPVSEPDKLAFWATATLAFFDLFRLGELLIGLEAEYSSASHLSWGDVALDSKAATTLVKIHLKRSKCDQFSAGADILMGRTGCLLCPVTTIIKFINCRGDSPGYFFIDGEKKPITKPRFIAQLRDYMKAAGLPSDQFAGHSFRIGAATTAAKAGIEDSMIQTLGRWHSAAFLRYIRTPHESLAALSVSLAIHVYLKQLIIHTTCSLTCLQFYTSLYISVDGLMVYFPCTC